MTKEIIIFNTIQEAETEKKKRSKQWRPLQTDFENNKIKVTFVKGSDDPNNSQESIDRRAKFQRRKDLQEKLENSSLNLAEINEYLRGL